MSALLTRIAPLLAVTHAAAASASSKPCARRGGGAALLAVSPVPPPLPPPVAAVPRGCCRENERGRGEGLLCSSGVTLPLLNEAPPDSIPRRPPPARVRERARVRLPPLASGLSMPRTLNTNRSTMLLRVFEACKCAYEGEFFHEPDHI
jgi:hypothetical protein